MTQASPDAPTESTESTESAESASRGGEATHGSGSAMSDSVVG